MQEGSLIPRFGRARRDPSLAVLEGFHPLKHALRFGANVLEVVSRDPAEVDRLAARLAPDLSERLHTLVREVEPAVFEQLAPLTPTHGGDEPGRAPRRRPRRRARRPAPGARGPARGPARPRQHGRLRARGRRRRRRRRAQHRQPRPVAPRRAARCRRAALRRCPSARLETAARTSAAATVPCWRSTPTGSRSSRPSCPPRALLAFGTERDGLSDELAARADAHVSIPMRAGVSSLNLATSVAAVLFAWRLSARTAPAVL